MISQQPPPFPAYQVNLQDESHLNTISVCHFVMAGLYLLGIGFVILHFMIMSMVFRMVEQGAVGPTATSGPMIVESSSTAPTDGTPESETSTVSPSELLGIPPSATASPVASSPAAFPKQIIPFFIIFYLIIGGFLVTICVCNALSGYYIRKRKNRIFSFIIAGINCMQFPLGTLLGVFTFIVLTRESVKMTYSMNVQN